MGGGAMVGGFNTNIRYSGRTFHVQTEDSGEANPQVHTLLFEGGAILHSQKRSYGDELSADNLESAVRALMEEQHRSVVQDLKRGALDDVIGLVANEARKNGERGNAGAAEKFGAGVITEKPLAEVILSHMSST
jgi:hypothetical protein